MSEKFLFTSESVTEGHPDKVADQISDTVVDAILGADPDGRIACETMVTTGVAFLGGEITTSTYVDLPSLVRKTIREIGYTSADIGFDADTCAVITSIDEQSADIAMGVNPGGAGDQGLMFGYACTETDVLMPLPITMAHRMAQQLAAVRKDGTLPWLRPDGKTQITAKYENNKPVAIDTVVVSTQHDADVSEDNLHEAVRTHVIEPVLKRFDIEHAGYTAHINPTGRFVVGGPLGDCGLTGRKIIVDTYGGSACHGGGAFSGKDSTKVDRSAAYAARHLAKNIVAAGLADRCQVQLAYAIGVAEPVSITVDTYGTGTVPNQAITDAIRKVADMTPKGIIDRLGLRKPIFRQTAAYGHFGREDVQFSWEQNDLVEQLKNAL
ncbi:MAG: methionine adenosyltransferase [bacterium]|nr:methionine adenosyltransferase [bacterium]